MFQTNQRIVCVDDSWPAWVFDLYKQLPKKGEVYTVRSLSPGRSNPNFVVNKDAEITMAGAQFDLLILLQELRNPDDPHSTIKQELGFRAERFADMLEETHYDTVEQSVPHELVPA